MLDTVAVETVDLIFADPPYNLSGKALKWEGNTTGGDWYMVDTYWDKMTPEEYLGFTSAWVEQSARVLRPGGSIYCSCTYHNLGEVIIAFKRFGLRLNNVITWYKTNAMPNMTRRTFTHACEYLVWACKGPKWTFDYDAMKQLNPERRKDGSPKQMRDMWSFPLCQGKERLRGADGRALHPTQKPEALVERVLLASSKKGDVVLDPFLGSGTTAVVAQRLGREFIGIEREKTYLTAAQERLTRLR